MATAVGTLAQARIRVPEAGHQNATPHGKDHNLHRVHNRTVNECEWKYVDQTVSARTSPSLRQGIAFSWKYLGDVEMYGDAGRLRGLIGKELNRNPLSAIGYRYAIEAMWGEVSLDRH